ncbi:MAG: NPCBM/NEW2 domain-containing protein, partial [Thermoguttaceae bacterium]|nr:NPCBM/NEW2 domain-containing protein [Thermoguttaceae bacterium]
RSGEYQAFEGEVGMQWQGGESAGSVVFQVFVDDRKEFDSGVMTEKDPPRKVRVAVKHADELRLVVTDAGDGITSDVANWAEARLIRDPEAAGRRAHQTVNVAPFGRVVTSDPKRTEGTKAGRSTEFPAEDLALTTELLAGDDGGYTVPVDGDGTGCIGLDWLEFRYFRELGLQFAEPDAVPDGVLLQQWIGGSSWQGEWQTLDAPVEKDQRAWTWTLAFPDRMKPTDKFRWLFPGAKKPIRVTTFVAHTTSSWRTAALRFEADPAMAGETIGIELYNGVFLEPDGEPNRRTWRPAEPLECMVRYARTRECKTDQTVLRFTMGGQAFGIAVEDVLANEAVYVPTAGLFATRNPAPATLAEYRAGLADRKTLRQRIEEMPEQTFERALAGVHLPIQNLGPTMLSLACDERKFVAYREGHVGFTLKTQPSAAFDGRTRRGRREFPLRIQPVLGDGNLENATRRLDGGWLPIPVTEVDQDGVVYSVRTFVAPIDDEAPAGAPAWLRHRAVCVAEYAVENTRPEAAEAVLMLSVLDTSREEQQRAFALEPVEGGVAASLDGRLLVFLDTGEAAPLQLKGDRHAAIAVGSLPAGATARVVAYLPAWHARSEDYGQFRGQSAGLCENVRRYWNGLMAPAAQIELPDELLTNVIRASQVHIMLAAGNEENGSRIDVWTSADRYGSLESESQPIIRGMDMMGQHDYARRGLDFFIARYNEAGFLTTGYTVMGSGWHLWTLAEFVDRSHDVDWFRGVAPEVARMCRWIVAQREKTKRVDARGQKAPNFGLTPPGIIADWARLTNTAFQEAHYYAGVRDAARVLAEIGHPDAPKLADNARQYREDILRAYRWTQARSPVVPRGDGTWVPAQPPIFFIFGNVGGFFPGEDGSRSWCKNADAHYLMVNGAVDPNSEEASWMLDIMEGIEFLRSGLAEPAYDAETNERLWFDLGGFNKCQPYYRRSVELYALRDEAKAFVRGYFNTIPSLLSLENLSFWEHFHNRGGWNKTHETGWFLCQTRLMLVQERGGELWLAPFVARNWLEDGKTVSVENAPTNFGPVSYRIDSAVDRGVIEATVDPPTVRPPGRIVLRLRHPSLKPIKAVTINGKPHADFSPEAETISLPADAGRLTLRVQYAE